MNVYWPHHKNISFP